VSIFSIRVPQFYDVSVLVALDFHSYYPILVIDEFEFIMQEMELYKPQKIN